LIDTSIIIATYNKKSDIELTLSGFNQQTYPADQFELVIVDDGSTDGTDALVQRFPSRHSLVYHRQSNAGRSAARNIGIQKANGSTLIFCDAEAIPEVQFVEQHVKHHTNTGNNVVLGAKYDVLARWDKDIPRTYLEDLADAAEFDDVRNTVDAARRRGHATFLTRADIDEDFERVRKWVFRRAPHNGDKVVDKFTSSLEGFAVPWALFVTVNVSLRKETIEAVGLFDEAFLGWGIEDTELGYRLYKGGAKFVYEEEAANYHVMHPVDRHSRRRDLAKNFSLFCEKHPAFEVFLLWRHARSKLETCTYSDIVNEYYRLNDLGQSSPLLNDYLALCQKTARDFAVNADFIQFIP
jgi:glycosyltransferase involved in cell wall biosynthesis